MNEKKNAPGQMAHGMLTEVLANCYAQGSWVVSVNYENDYRAFGPRMKICGDAISDFFRLQYEVWFAKGTDGRYIPQYILITEKGRKKGDQERCWSATPTQGGFELLSASPDALRLEGLLTNEPPT